MPKRKCEDDQGSTLPPSKRLRTDTRDHLSDLSPELILRILSFLPVSQLVICQRLSRKYHILAGDEQLWKAAYYDRFVRPRRWRLRSYKDGANTDSGSKIGSRASQWLDEEHLLGNEAQTRWKQQYRLRHNWRLGSARINEIPVAEQSTVPPIVVQMHNGAIYMADKKDGLRVWAAKADEKMMGHISLRSGSMTAPTSLAVCSDQSDGSEKIVVGYENGLFDIYVLRKGSSPLLRLVHAHRPSTTALVSSVSITWPYVAVLTATQRLSVYKFSDENGQTESPEPPRLLYSLRSQSVHPPLSTSLRSTTSGLAISIAYTLPTYLSGWTVGLQEISLSHEGALVSSRLASAIDQHYRPLAFSLTPVLNHLSSPAATLASATTLEMRHIHSRPTSLSYSHPYLLVSHPDNTLALYLVTSNTEALSISAGSRLWGHTSSVSGAQVGGRGKAVSISRRGDELRLWELEGGFTSAAAKKRLASTDLSVQVRPTKQGHPDLKSTTNAAELTCKAMSERGSGCCAIDAQRHGSDVTLTRGWIGFDEEKVVVLQEQARGRQSLLVYDFT